MNRKLTAALVIARRDYVASVFSKTFLLFLIGPLLPLIFALVFALSGGGDETAGAAPAIVIVADGPAAPAIKAAHARLADAMGDAVPRIRIEAPARDRPAQIRHLLREPATPMVLSGLPDAPLLSGPKDMIESYRQPIALIIDDSHRSAALDRAHVRPHPMAIALHAIGHAPAADTDGRQSTAHGAQLTVFVLTMILATMVLSNLIEEKSSKVIEILAAAVPVDAIFFGKLLGMLAMSLTAIAIWGATALTGLLTLAPHLIAGISAPAVGWPAMVAICTCYFVASYLLLGALFLGIGAQAASVREVQTLSLPVTTIQLGVFGLASAVVAHPDGDLAIAAMVFPWSSPLAMTARAALLPSLWPHLIALLWQALWVALIILLGARMFRRSVLQSGGPRHSLIGAIRNAVRRRS